MKFDLHRNWVIAFLETACRREQTRTAGWSDQFLRHWLDNNHTTHHFYWTKANYGVSGIRFFCCSCDAVGTHIQWLFFPTIFTSFLFIASIECGGQKMVQWNLIIRALKTIGYKENLRKKNHSTEFRLVFYWKEEFFYTSWPPFPLFSLLRWISMELRYKYFDFCHRFVDISGWNSTTGTFCIVGRV